SIRRSVEKSGVSRDLIDRLLAKVPRAATSRVLARAFGWDAMSPDSGRLTAPIPGLNVRFKTTRSDADPARSPLLHLAVVSSRLVREHAVIPDYVGVPALATDMRAETVNDEGQVTL